MLESPTAGTFGRHRFGLPIHDGLCRGHWGAESVAHLEQEMKRHGNEKKHPATGVGSCTLVNTDPDESANTAKAVYRRTGQINFVPDGYDCYGAKFAKFGVEFRRFPQPKDFRITNRRTVARDRHVRRACVLPEPPRARLGADRRGQSRRRRTSRRSRTS